MQGYPAQTQEELAMLEMAQTKMAQLVQEYQAHTQEELVATPDKPTSK